LHDYNFLMEKSLFKEVNNFEILSLLPIATFAIDNKGEIVFWNKSMEKLSGLEASEMMGKGNYEYSISFFGKRQAMLCDHLREGQIQSLLTSDNIRIENGAFIHEFEITTHFGRTINFREKTFFINNKKEEHCGVIEMIESISYQKKIESKLKNAKEENIQSSKASVKINRALIASNEELKAVNDELLYKNTLLEKEITQREAAEKELEKSEGIFKAFLEQSVDGIAIINQYGEYLEWNKCQEQITGIVKSEVIGAKVWEINVLPADEQKKELNMLDKNLFLKQIINNEKYTIFEDSILSTNLQEISLQILSFTINVGSLRLVGRITRDISEKKNQELQLEKYKNLLEDLLRIRTLELRISENLFTQLFENAPDGIIVGDPNGIIINANNAISKLCGISKDEIRGKVPEIFFDKEQILLNPLNFSQIEFGEVLISERMLKTADNKTIPVEIRTNKLPDNYLQTFIRDISERKEAERSLIESEGRIKTIFDSVNDAIFVHDAITGEVLDVNHRSCEMYEYTREELISIPFNEISHGEYPYNDVAALEWIRKAATGVPQIFEWHAKNKSGNLFWIEIGMRLAKINNADRIIVAIRDVNARKKAETEIIRLNESLENRVKDRTFQLEAANKELSEFAYVVSHDLKAPLRGINQLAEWLVNDYETAFDQSGKEMIGLLRNRISRMENLIEGILQYSRIGRMFGKDEWVDMHQLVCECIDSLAVNDKISIKILNLLPHCYGDRLRISQVFQNLISNAIKYMDKEQGFVEIFSSENDREFIFCVKDNGPGIDKKYFEKIFQIFQTLTPRDERESTGIGLALVKKIIELREGKVWVESELGEGSKFFFTLIKRSNHEQ